MQVLTVFVVLLVVAGAFAAIESKNQDNNLVKNDQGQFVPCSDTDPPITLNWSPKVLKPGITVTINFDMTPVIDLDSGNADITVWMEYPDPVFQISEPFNCEMINKHLPITCPFMKGEEYKLFGYRVQIPESTPVPPGDFRVEMRVKDNKGNLFACLKGSVTLDTVSYDYN